MILGWAIGGFVAALYATMCIWIGVKKPENMIRLTKKKLGGKLSNEATAKACIVIGTVAGVFAIVCFILGATL